jgi:hypothetical protein
VSDNVWVPKCSNLGGPKIIFKSYLKLAQLLANATARAAINEEEDFELRLKILHGRDFDLINVFDFIIPSIKFISSYICFS